MSEIITNKLTGKTAAGNVTVTNGTTTQKLQDGVVCTHSLYDHQNTAVDISLNVSSVEDVSTGNYRPSFTSNFSASKEYVVSHDSQDWYDNGGTSDSILYSDSTSTTAKIYLRHYENNTARDTQYLALMMVGDLA